MLFNALERDSGQKLRNKNVKIDYKPPKKLPKIVFDPVLW